MIINNNSGPIKKQPFMKPQNQSNKVNNFVLYDKNKYNDISNHNDMTKKSLAVLQERLDKEYGEDFCYKVMSGVGELLSLKKKLENAKLKLKDYEDGEENNLKVPLSSDYTSQMIKQLFEDGTNYGR